MASADDFMGKQKRAAQNLAEARNLRFHLVESEGERMLGWPEDVATDRICCVVKNSAVVQAVMR